MQPFPLGSVPAGGEMDPSGERAVPTLSGLFVSLSLAVFTLSLTLATVISLIAWALG